MRTCVSVLFLLSSGCLLFGAEEPNLSAELTEKGMYSLADFGPVSNPQEAQAAFDRAVETLSPTGGVLVIPKKASEYLTIENTSQELVRVPPPPEPATTWHDGPGLTLIESGKENVTLYVPPMSGLRISRTLRMNEGDSLPHWSTNPVLTLESNLIHGSNSYLDWLQWPVEKGPDRRFYLPTIRGIRPGQFLNVHGEAGYGGGVLRAYVKSLGYDHEKQMHYFVADTSLDHVAGAIVHNKNNTGLLHMLQNCNADNQTYDVKVIRNHYAHGDTYIYYCDFNYMSNVHSAAGDENGNCYAAFIRSLSGNFRGQVEAMDWEKNRLTFTPDARNVETLGDSRPLINLNPQKWITSGKVWIVPAESYWETTDTGKFPFQGKTYPTQLVKNPRTDVPELRMGGLIRGDRDCPWTEEVVGRFFAVTEEGERVPGGNLRWYEITSLKQNGDGTKDLEIRRYWWGAKSAGSPTLYNVDNGSWDGHLKPLRYAIAPGTYVNDVSYAIPGGRGGKRMLGLAPSSDQGTPCDFAPGDPLEQALGPDPFKPQAFRVWMWEDVPGVWPSAVLDLANYGAASRYAAMVVGGGGQTLEEVQQRQEKKPAWDNVIVVDAAATVGLNFNADFADSALLFRQPHREQAIKWHYGQQEGKAPKEATLNVSKATGALTYKGGGLCVEGGLSGSETPARNLRGKNVEVKAGAKSVSVKFPVAEVDGDYAVFLELSWLTNRAITKKTPAGFTVQFDQPAPKGARLDWILVR